jgi:hypothetical protein
MGYCAQMLTALLMYKLAIRTITLVPVLIKFVLFCLFLLICAIIAAFVRSLLCDLSFLPPFLLVWSLRFKFKLRPITPIL